ncbi:MAG: uracil-DNA glycosylase family protein [Patescibacteria group bacterium]
MGKEELLERLAEVINDCRKCRLHKTRTNAVPGDGDVNTQVMLVGQCPGVNEDEQGLPFVGRAGKLLEKLLSTVGLQREDVYITNVVKCRPPENRDPMADEIRGCSPYLDEEIRTVNPKVIVTLGRFAMEHFISEGSITENHGRALRCGGRALLPVYHPAAALRNGRLGKDLREDFAKIPKILAGEIELERVEEDDEDDQVAMF